MPPTPISPDPGNLPFICAALPSMTAGFGIWRGIQNYLNHSDRKWNITHSGAQHDLLRRLQERSDLGGIIAFAANPGLQEDIASLAIPAINVSTRLKHSCLRRVRVDECETGRMAGRYLIDCGYKRLLCCLNPETTYFDELRLQGIREEISNSERQVALLEHPPKLDAILRNLTADDPKAVVVVSHFELALKLMDSFRKLPASVREEAGLLCMDDPSSSFHWHQEEPISFIRLPWESVGFEAARLLNRWMESGVPPPNEQLIQGHAIVARESTRRWGSLTPVTRAVVGWMDNAYDPRMGVEELAHALGFSVSSLYKHYRAAFGKPLREELTHRRHQHACHLLADSHLTVKEIGGRCGYQTASAFIAAFRKREGCTPSQWRRRG